MKRDAESECHKCKKNGVLIAEGEGIGVLLPLRQFQCNTESCKDEGKTWLKRTTEMNCNKCGEEATLIPKGEEIGVLVFEFICGDDDCRDKYTVLCRWVDTADCYKCKREDNPPTRFLPRRFIMKKSNKRHLCSRCKNKCEGNCPNIREHRQNHKCNTIN